MMQATIHPPTGKWPRIQFTFTCKTCDVRIKLSIYYGESNIWSNTGAPKLAEWAEHVGHETTLEYEFYAGRWR